MTTWKDDRFNKYRKELDKYALPPYDLFVLDSEPHRIYVAFREGECTVNMTFPWDEFNTTDEKIEEHMLRIIEVYKCPLKGENDE